MSKCPNLEVLLSTNHIRDDANANNHIPPLGLCNRTLQELWASHNPFASVTVLGDLSALHKLSRLVFSPNKSDLAPDSLCLSRD